MIEIQDNQALAELCDRAGQETFIVLDTEFIRERTFYPILALVQIAWENGDPILIDPLEITDWSPFHRLMMNPKVCKIFHAGRQDLEIFYNQMGTLPVNLFDTQIAASLCGFGDQIGYSALVDRLLGVHLAKGSSYTNWLRRPLTDTQLAYARDDVRYLSDVYAKLVALGQSKQRLDWIQQEMEDQFTTALFEPNLDELWRKVKKGLSLRPKNLAVLQAFARWRYKKAREMDKPVRFLFSDEVMIELAKVEHLSAETLDTRRGLSQKFVERFGAKLIDLHAQARLLPKAKWPVLRKARDTAPSDKSLALADIAWLLFKELARGADLAPSYLSTKKELALYLEARHRGGDLSGFSFEHGWRKALTREPLTDLIEGRLVIKVHDRRIVWENTRES